MHNLLRLAGAVACAGAAAASGAGLPDGAFGWMQELAGSCWVATYPDGTRDEQCYDTQFDRFLRGTIEIRAAAADRQPYRGDSVLAWDSARSEIRFTFWGSRGNHGSLIGRVEGRQIIFPGQDAAGAQGPITRTVWSRIDERSFRVVQQSSDGSRWSDVMTLVYVRTGRR